MRRNSAQTRHCTYCRRPETPEELLSWRSICRSCARQAMIQNNLQISSRQGPYYEQQLRGRARMAIKRAEANGVSI